MYKKLLVFSLLPLCCFADNAENQESKLLHEWFEEKLEQNGHHTNWSFSGNLNGSAIAINQSLSQDDNCFATLEGEAFINYDGKYDGLGYGIEICNKIRSGIIKGGNAIVDSSYLYIESDKYGKFKFGYTNTAADEFSLSYAAILTGYAGPDSGNLDTFYAQTSGSIIATGFERDDGNALKIVWLSPTVNGWSMGLSYTPNSRDGHLFKEEKNKIQGEYNPDQNYADESSYSKHNFTGGISYEYGAEDDFNFKISLAGWYGRGHSDGYVKKVRNVTGYNIGAILGYKNYKLALGYTDNGKSLMPSKFIEKSESDKGFCYGADAGKIYNIGVGYTYDKLELSVGYFHAVRKFSSNERSNSNIATIAAQYNFDKTFSAYIEYDNIRTRTCKRSIDTEGDPRIGGDGEAFGNNRANMFVIGTKINF